MNNKFTIWLLSTLALMGVLIAGLALSRNEVVEQPIEAVAKSLPLVASSTRHEIMETPTSTLIFGGDVMLSRVVGQKMKKYNNYNWPLEKVADVMSTADLTIVNLESPMKASGNHVVLTGSFSFDADPKSVAALKNAGVDLVSLANNHFGNQGQQGMKDTFKILTDNNIKYAGAGVNTLAAHTPQIFEVNDLKIAFLAYAYPEQEAIATDKLAGMANMNLIEMQKDIAGIKNKVDLVIVMMHDGIEYVNKPNSHQQNFARAAIESGADLVVGHHPHWVQTTEKYKNKYIIYSLGNLVFDQMWSRETQQGALAKIYIKDKKIRDVEIIPIHIYDYGQAQMASSTESQEILKRMELKNNFLTK